LKARREKKRVSSKLPARPASKKQPLLIDGQTFGSFLASCEGYASNGKNQMVDSRATSLQSLAFDNLQS
jgi:hypothetical protein